MNERIDHAAQARKIMLEVNTDDRGVVPLELLDEIEKWVYDATMREAQVHATLALVEQQRIANLIALSVPQEISHGAEARIPSYEPGGNLREDIRKALGLA